MLPSQWHAKYPYITVYEEAFFVIFQKGINYNKKLGFIKNFLALSILLEYEVVLYKINGDICRVSILYRLSLLKIDSSYK